LEKNNVIHLLDFGSIELNEIDQQFLEIEKQKKQVEEQSRLICDEPEREKD